MLYNPLSAFKRGGVAARAARRQAQAPAVLLNGIGSVVRHARETVLRLVGEARRQLADAARLALATGPPFVCTA